MNPTNSFVPILNFPGEENKIIAITSCTPSEGKSTVSLSTAYSLAEAGKKVCLLTRI